MQKKGKTCKTCLHCDYDKDIPEYSFCNKSGSYLERARTKHLNICDKDFSGWEKRVTFFDIIIGR